MNVHASPPMTKEEFLRWAERQEGKYEYVGGRVIVIRESGKVIVGASAGHNEVALELVFALRGQIDPAKLACSAFDFAVLTRNGVRYPDVMLRAREADPKALAAANPLLIAEVLSPSTLHVDFGPKTLEYTALPSLQAYLVLAQDEPRIWAWRRAEDGAFAPEPEIVEGREAAVAIPTLGLELKLEDIYRGVGG